MFSYVVRQAFTFIYCVLCFGDASGDSPSPNNRGIALMLDDGEDVCPSVVPFWCTS